MCEKVIEDEPEIVGFVLDHFKTKTICEKAIKDDPCNLKIVPDHLKTQEMCDKAVRINYNSVIFVLDWFVNNK